MPLIKLVKCVDKLDNSDSNILLVKILLASERSEQDTYRV